MPWLDSIGAIMIASVLSNFYTVTMDIFIVSSALLFVHLLEVDLFIWLIIHRFQLNKLSYKHRDLLHYPILFLPLGSLLVLFLSNYFFSLLFLLCSLFHFLHDSFGVGWGIKWLWPFSNKNFKLFSRKHPTKKRRLIISWTPEELEKEVQAIGDNWLKYYHFFS